MGKRKVKLIFKGKIDDLDEDLVYQQSFALLSPEAKLAEAWKLVEHAWKLKGRNLNELRFNRTVALIKRV